MMRWIVGSSLRFRFLVLAFAAGMMLFGITQLRNAPVDVFPEFAPPRVEVQTPSLGLSAAEVESLVTVPLEQALAGIERLDVMRSKSVRDLSSIELSRLFNTRRLASSGSSSSTDRKSTRLNSSHTSVSRMPSSA